MDFIPKHQYLQVNPNTLEEVRRDVNLHRPGEMKGAVTILQEWIQQQPHFKKKDFPTHYLEIIIVTSKGSLERAKKLIDNACTLRTLMPKSFEPVNFKESFRSVWDETYNFLLPNLTPDNCRIAIFRPVGKCKNADLTHLLYKHGYMLIDYTQHYDYYSKVVLIYDFLDMDMADALSKINLIDSKNFAIALMDGYGMRLKRIHLLTKSKLIEKAITFFRPFLKKKLMDRVVVHQSTEELHQYYPRAILPKDFGGDDKTISELHGECLNMISTEEHLEYAKSIFEAQVDEALRPKGQFNDMYAGTMGSFRALSLD